MVVKLKLIYPKLLESKTNPLLSAFPYFEKEFREIVKYSLDLIVNRTAHLIGLTHKTINQIYLKMRLRLLQD